MEGLVTVLEFKFGGQDLGARVKVLGVDVGVVGIADRPVHLTKDGLVSPAGEESARGVIGCLLYTSPSPRDGLLSRMPSSA